jgi:hypothetical protein
MTIKFETVLSIFNMGALDLFCLWVCSLRITDKIYFAPFVIRVVAALFHNLQFLNVCQRQGMQHEWVRGGMHIGYWWEIQKEGDYWEDQDVDGS